MRTVAAVVIAWAMVGTAYAQGPDPLRATFTLDAGWFVASTDVRVRVNGRTSGPLGTHLDFDDTFDIGEFDRFRIEGAWRIGKRHLLSAMYFHNERVGTRRVERAINFAGRTFPIGASVTGESEFSVAQLSYGYALLQGDSYELAASVGAHYIDMQVRMSGEVDVASGTLRRSTSGEATTAAPLPVVGLRAMRALTPNLYLSGHIHYTYIRIDPYAGSLVDVKAALVWKASDHFGVGVAYNGFGLRFDVDERDRYNGRLEWDYGGTMAFVSLMF